MSVKKKVRCAELKMAMFVAEHNLPFAVKDHLPKWVQSAFPDSEIAKNVHCGRKRTTAILTEVILPENFRSISEAIREGPLYSIVVDESTDIGSVKSLAVAIPYFYGPRSVFGHG